MKLIIGLGLSFLVSSVLGYMCKERKYCPFLQSSEELEVCYDIYNTFIGINECNDSPNKTLILKLCRGTTNTIKPYTFNNSHIRVMMVIGGLSPPPLSQVYRARPRLSLSQNSFVGMLELEELKLHGVIIKLNDQNPFAPLGALKVLSLRGIDLRRILVEMLASLPKLERLDLKNNLINTIRSNSFALLQNLTTLDLSGNGITQIEPNAFNGLLELEELTLDDNRIELAADMFQGMPKLKVLKLNRAFYIRKLEDGVFNGLPGLTELYLEGNRIEWISTEVFQKLVSMRKLDLSSNLIGNIPVDAFRNLTSLENIDLGNNELGLEIRFFRIFSGLVLDTLILRSNQIVTIQTDKWKNLSIRNLDLSENRIGDKASGVFNGLTVKTLNLTRNLLSTIDAHYFDGFHSENLDLRRNNIEGIAKGALKDKVMEILYIRPITMFKLLTDEYSTDFDKAQWGLPESVTVVSD